MFTCFSTDRQAGRQAGRQADRQTDRQTDRHTHTNTCVCVPPRLGQAGAYACYGGRRPGCPQHGAEGWGMGVRLSLGRAGGGHPADSATAGFVRAVMRRNCQGKQFRFQGGP